jgi:hypothetical protein
MQPFLIIRRGHGVPATWQDPLAMDLHAILPNEKAAKRMVVEKSLIDSALRAWKSNIERADKLFGALSPGELEKEIAPGRNRLIYVWGHLAAVNDALIQACARNWERSGIHTPAIVRHFEGRTYRPHSR